MSTEIPKPKPDALDVLLAIDALRRDLSGYHGQLKAWNDLSTHSERQRERIRTLEELHATDKQLVADLRTDNAKLRELVRVFYHCTTSGECDYCPINGGGTVKLMPDTICDTIHDRMRELGVEV